MKFYKFLVVIFVVLCNDQLQAQDSLSFKTVSIKAFDSLTSTLPVFQIIDVRTEDEYNTQHIKGALNRNVYDKKFVKQFRKNFPSKEITYVIYCKSGGRSVRASKALTANGYKIINLKEGISAVPEELLWKAIPKE